MARASLKALSRQALTVDEMMDSLQALTKESEQAEAVIGASLVEDALKQALMAKMRDNLSSQDRADVFENFAPLAGLSPKIAVAYALAIIGPATRADLHCVRDIRNAFAHSKRTLSFAHPPVKAACATLTTPASLVRSDDDAEWPPKIPREQYRATVRLLWLHLVDEVGRERLR